MSGISPKIATIPLTYPIPFIPFIHVNTLSSEAIP